ncbi:hypothetical protein EJB05_54524 [Eragrostis curvula]|uniref:Uncharacterized protein n=1 Tax=Eragrostis curvula TaxID=38414 RepID=A0A5J9SM27_9POAL|nr:hypothetical protein EJB05_54524 [Eragrostis curvula]
MATVARHFGFPPPAPPPTSRSRRRASFLAGAARGRIKRSRLHNLSCLVSRTAKASVSSTGPSAGGEDVNEIIDAVEIKSTTTGASFLAKVAVAIGIATAITVILLYMKQPPSSPSFSLPHIVDAQSDTAATTIGYTFSLFGKKVIIPEYTPGWVYFLLLMAAGFGLFISEEALNVWVGISLGRTLCLDGTWQSFVNSFSANASYIISTVLWVYWGVCLSDMIPFCLGKLFRQTGASENISSKIGIGKEQALSITRGVQKHGNLIGFVERFSIGVRNPTAFLAGALGISADCFFAGVCCGCLFTLPVQLDLSSENVLWSHSQALQPLWASGTCSLMQPQRARRCSSTSVDANPAPERVKEVALVRKLAGAATSPPSASGSRTAMSPVRRITELVNLTTMLLLA